MAGEGIQTGPDISEEDFGFVWQKGGFSKLPILLSSLRRSVHSVLLVNFNIT